MPAEVRARLWYSSAAMAVATTPPGRATATGVGLAVVVPLLQSVLWLIAVLDEAEQLPMLFGTGELERLRRAIEPATVEGRDSLALVLPEPAWVDVEVARGAVISARAATEASERLTYAQTAMKIAEPGLLPGLEAPWLTASLTKIPNSAPWPRRCDVST